MGDNLPPGVAEQLAPQLQTVLGNARPGLLSIGALGALWAATGGIASLMTAMNKAYDVDETRSFFLRYGLAIMLTIVGSAGILVAFVTVVGGSVLTEQAIEVLGVAPETWNVISLLRFPLVLVLVALAVAVLFRFGPNVAVSFRWTLVGGVLFAVGWLVATVFFGLYVANFGSYANTYGALGGVVILMLWFYLTALLLLLAAEVTSVLANDKEPHRVQAARTETAIGRQAKETAQRAGRRTGRVAGVLAGIMQSVAGRDDTPPSAADQAADAEDDRRRDEREARRARARTRRGGHDPLAMADGESGATRSPSSEAGPAPIRRLPRTEPSGRYVTFEPRPSRSFALVVFVLGGIAGALAGLLADDDEDGDATA
jgi:membrane protein